MKENDRPLEGDLDKRTFISRDKDINMSQNREHVAKIPLTVFHAGPCLNHHGEL